ncbi:Elongator complex protein 4 [Coniella lustricola]|uniref:Elongator complex protein 4 n=1 Tax=Coniella lustricola TaxID=2025994 RepID=A0A2T3AKP1_9PEZI|nr:Elongator complex protein 4 [Coniella lustricola]
MSFRKRNAIISSSSSSSSAQARSEAQLSPGLRPSPLDGRTTTSTGTASLDGILAGHAGLPLGTSLLVEEHGTTDFSGSLLKYYAAEGLVQGHQVHVLGYPPAWKHELPALSTKQNAASTKVSSHSDDKMKIAWRYESLASRNAPTAGQKDDSKAVFCHTFDLTKKLAPTSIVGAIAAMPASEPPGLAFETKQSPSAFEMFIQNLQNALQASPPSTIHRVVVPSLMTPTLYSAAACLPAEILQFLHALRSILRRYPGQLTALLTINVTLFPRHNGATRWIELLSDGVLEMIPLPPKLGGASLPPGNTSKTQDQSQGILRVHSLPVLHEKGGGGTENNHFREDLSFRLSSTKGLVIQPYVLPPMEDEDHKEKSPASTVKDGIEF